MINLTQEELKLLNKNGYCIAIRNNHDYLVEKTSSGKRKITRIIDDSLEF